MGWDSRTRTLISREEALAMARGPWTVTDLANPPAYRANGGQGPLRFERLIGIGEHRSCTVGSAEDIPRLRAWLDDARDIVMGWVGYEAKNLLERLSTGHAPRFNFPALHFFIPEHVIMERNSTWELYSHGAPVDLMHHRPLAKKLEGLFLPEMEDYVGTVGRILSHIQLGDIYETNICVESGFNEAVIDPPGLFEEMIAAGKAPFSCRVAYEGGHLVCASPERFMGKVGRRVFSQPMKGTSRRQPANAQALDALRNDPKERAENIMITDLVRNDLSRHAAKGTVRVDELCGAYPFAHVNQLISTVSCELQEDAHPLDMLLGAFPMGSMTGAPKVRAMQLMDAYEGFGRGLFSGSVGYFTPELDFDFNVVIRGVLYSEHSNKLSFHTGGAITSDSVPEREFEECMLKAEATLDILKAHVGKD